MCLCMCIWVVYVSMYVYVSAFLRVPVCELCLCMCICMCNRWIVPVYVSLNCACVCQLYMWLWPMYVCMCLYICNVYVYVALHDNAIMRPTAHLPKHWTLRVAWPPPAQSTTWANPTTKMPTVSPPPAQPSYTNWHMHIITAYYIYSRITTYAHT